MIRRALIVAALALATACNSSSESGAAGDFNSPPEGAGGSDAGAAAPGSESARCWVDDDCEAVASSCCECPTFAAPVSAGIGGVCEDVSCDPEPSGCAMRTAVCSAEGQCELACAPLACELSCAGGFARDPAGCSLCACAGPELEQELGCDSDPDCLKVPADCCGCARGGEDRAIAAQQADDFADARNCSGGEACPEVDLCDANLAPSCVFGRCALTPTMAAQVPAEVCGAGASPSCSSGLVCVLNPADYPELSASGLGACLPP